ncbi:hypothetical protein [Nocardia sp. MH4]|nr:hypothetical protein [Nocardia sp. MH4]
MTLLALIGGLCALAVGSLVSGYAVVVLSYWLELHRDPPQTQTQPDERIV